MRFILIDPARRAVERVEADDVHKASPKLSTSNVGHGSVAPGIGIIVYQYGLLEGAGPYFALDRQLYAGDAILYGVDQAGETIDMPPRLPIAAPLWLDTKEDVERAIRKGLVDRPQTAVNGAVLWQWE